MRTSCLSSFVYQRSARRRVLSALPTSTNPCPKKSDGAKNTDPGGGSRQPGQVKLTNRIVGKRKVSSRKRKKVEYRRTEGDPRNTQASFRLRDFKMWTFCTVMLLLALPPVVNSNKTPTPRMCAVCLEKDCANAVRTIYPAGSDTAVWVKRNSPTGIQNCSMENLKPDAPCEMANGGLVQLADNPLQFEGIDTHDVRRAFNSQISPCADLNLPPSSMPSPVTKAPIHDTSNPAAPNDSVADNKSIIIGSVIGIIIIFISIGVLIWMLCNCRRGQDRGRLQGNSRVPPHDAEHRDETTKMQVLNAEDANGNVDEVH